MGIIAQSGDCLVRLITDQGNNHAVEVEEEHQEMETELDEGFLLRCQIRLHGGFNNEPSNSPACGC